MQLRTRVKAKRRSVERQKQRSHSSQEIKKIPNDWVGFAKLITIQSGDLFTNFNPYDYQIQLNQCFDANHTTIGVKSRQMGWTTYAESKALHKAILNPAYTAIFLSQTQNDASLIAYNVRQMLQSIPEYATAVNDNLLILRIKNGGTLHFRSPGPNATRGIPSVSDIFIDEAAFIDNIELLYGQVKNTQSMVKNAHTLIISTPNTVTDWFYRQLTNNSPDLLETINKIRKGEQNPIKIINDHKSGWAKFICHWKAHPVYSANPNYLRDCAEKDQIPLEMVYRERDLSFENNILNVFPYNLVERCFNLPCDRQEEPDENINYYLGIDTAGAGKDYFVCTVLKIADGKIQLIDYYRNRTNTTPVHLDRISELIKKYNPYRASIEVNSGGQQYYDLIKENFPSLDLKGVNTSQRSKSDMITKLLYLMENDEFESINDKAFREEFLSFQKIGEKLTAPEGKHDDCVMATAVGVSGIKYYK